MQGLTSVLAQVATAEAADRTVLFGPWPTVSQHLGQDDVKAELHSLIRRRRLSLRGLSWHRPLVVLDDCPQRIAAGKPATSFLRFVETLQRGRVPFVLGVKCTEDQGSAEYLGHLAPEDQRVLKVRSGERQRIVTRWVDLAEKASGRTKNPVDRQELRAWLSDRYHVYKGNLPILLWLVSRHVGVQLFDRSIEQAHDALDRLDEDARAVVETYCVLQSVRPVTARRLLIEDEESVFMAIDGWRRRVQGVADEFGTSSSTATALAAFEIADRCAREKRLAGLVDKALEKLTYNNPADDERRREWRVVLHGLVEDWSPATAGLTPSDKAQLRHELRQVALNRGLLESGPDFQDPTTKLAAAATARALGAIGSATRHYRALLEEAPWITGLERPEWFWPSLLIGLRETAPDALSGAGFRQALIECEHACQTIKLRPKMALGLARVIWEGVEASTEFSPEETRRLLSLAETLARRVTLSPGWQRKGAHATARLMGGLSGSYEWNGRKRPDLEEAVQWAQSAFASEPEGRRDPARMCWQDIITHDLLGSLYRAEFSRSGFHEEDADHHSRLPLEALPRRDLEVDWEHQLNHCVRSFTGYGRWCHRRGDIDSAQQWYRRAVRVIEELPIGELPPDGGLAYLRRDLFWESISHDPSERFQGLVAGLEVIEPSQLRGVLEARLTKLRRALSR
jgi:hypothetical protein